MTNAILAPSELDTMASLLQRLAKAFNDGGGICAVASEMRNLGSLLTLRQGEPPVELIAYWLEKRNYRVPLE